MGKHAKLLGRSAAIVLVACAIGFITNILRPDGLPLIRQPKWETRPFVTAAQTSSHAPGSPNRSQRPEAPFTTLKEAKALFKGGSALFVDARALEDYEAGHIRGAVSLYYDDVDQLYPGTIGRLPKTVSIVVYCSEPDCESAVRVGDRLLAMGHRRTMILLEGLPGWKNAGLPIVTGKEPG